MAFDRKYSRLTNGHILFDSNSLYAKAEDITLPELKAKLLEHKVLGGVGTVKLPSGYDSMEAMIKLNGPCDEISSASANIKKSHEFIFRGNVEGFSGQDITSERPYVCIFRGTFSNSPGGSQKQHENIELSYSISVTYYKLMIDGVVRSEVDFVNNILKVDGVDLLTKYKQNLGL